jgi:hypothetical protein
VPDGSTLLVVDAKGHGVERVIGKGKSVKVGDLLDNLADEAREGFAAPDRQEE